MTTGAKRDDARRDISRQCVGLLKETVGRGPTTARTYFGDGLVIVILEDTLTRSERVLAADGRVDLVREMRRTLLETINGPLCALIGEKVGADVRVLLSDHVVDPDYAAIAALLEPAGDGAVASELARAELQQRDAEAHQERQRAIARGITAIYKESLGRGPTDIRVLADERLVAVSLGGTLTKVEQTLADGTGREPVRGMRREFQDSIRKRAAEVVAAETGSTVEAFLSDHSIEADEAIEIFLLSDPAAG